MPADFTSRVVSIEQMGRLTRGIAGTFGFISNGGAVTVSSGMVLNVAAVSANTAVINGTVGPSAAYVAATVTITAADATNPRVDIVWINSSGVVAVAAGTAAATPVPPTIGATGLELAEILVGAGVTSITASDIIDRRQIAMFGPRLIARASAAATTTATVSTTLVTLSTDIYGNSLSIPVTRGITIKGNFRKTATAANIVSFGLNINATTVFTASAAVSFMGSSGTQRAEDGAFTIEIAPRSSADYLTGVNTYYIWRVSSSGAIAVSPVFSTAALANPLPNAAITSVVLTGINETANNNVELFDIEVWVW